MCPDLTFSGSGLVELWGRMETFTAPPVIRQASSR